jgi:hypothetical protein
LRPIVTNDRVAASAELPTIAVTNFRSLGPRLQNVKDDILLRQIDVLVGSETWQKDSNRKLKDDIEELLQIYGIEYISCPRPNTKRGGGVAILVNTKRFSITKLDILVPSKLVVVWGILRPKEVTKTNIFKQIILAGIYSPPNYRKNSALQTHLISTMHHLLTLHPQAGYCISGDKNSLPLAPILAALPHCRQAVTQNTYKDKILDVIMWNMSQYFSTPFITKAVPADNPVTHVPSDHDCAVAVPLAGAGAEARTRQYSVKTNQPLPDSGIREMGQWLADIQWEILLRPEFSPEEQDQILRSALQHKVDQIFPQKSVRISSQDVSFITADIKKLNFYMKKEYNKRGKTAKYYNLKLAYDTKYRKAAEHQLNKHVEDMMTQHPGRAYSALKRMGARPGDCENDGVFSIISHQNENLDTVQSNERILKYFANISQKFQPLELARLPLGVRNKLSMAVNQQDIPVIEAYQVYEKMRTCKKTKSAVPGEMPARLRQEYYVELAGPAAIIFNNIAQTGMWPLSWKEEFGTVLKKTTSAPEDESQLRIISITYQLSTLMERFVIDWLLVYIEDKMDRDQFGGQKGHSISHYLIEITNFIHYNQDLSKPLSTIFAGIDISKGFNKVCHNEIITILGDEMNVPGWLLRIVADYLSGRSLALRRQGHTTNSEPMPGGTGAGCPLGLLLFLVLFSGAGPPASRTDLGQIITSTGRMRKPLDKRKVKWVDDMSCMAALHLPSSLVVDTRPDIPRPVPYRGRHGLMLPRESNTLQDELDSLNLYAVKRKMSVNHQKTKVMLFSRHKNYDFLPELELIQDEKIEVVEQMKIVGYILRSDLKTCSNTEFIIKKAYGRMWILRRLKALGASRIRLLDVLQKQILSVLNLGVPAWDSLLTEQEKEDFERVLKTGLKIIWGKDYSTFDTVIKEGQISTMRQVREKIVKKFVKKTIKHIKFKRWFSEHDSAGMNTRTGNRAKFKTVPARKAFFQKSPIPTITNLANLLTKHK